MGYQTVNTIQQQAYLERLPIKRGFFQNIMGYDLDNLYPNKCRTAVQRSAFTTAATNTFGKYVLGRIEMNADEYVNEDDTLQDLLMNCAEDLAIFNGFAILLNYNMLGQVVSLEYVPFEYVRYNKTCTKFMINTKWNSPYDQEAIKYEVNIFDPENAVAEMELEGVENYNGQLFYFKNKGASEIYPVARIDAALDAAQFDSDRMIYALTNIQSDYSLGGILNVPTVGTDEDEVKALKEDVQNDIGAKNAGGVRVVSSLNPDVEYKYTPISRNDIDNLFAEQFKQSLDAIFAVYKMPKILAGIETQGMFNQQQFSEAKAYFNEETAPDRRRFMININKILEYSVFEKINLLEL